MMDELRRKKLLKGLSEVHSKVLPDETGKFSSDEGTTYSKNAGLPGFNSIIEKQFNDEYPDDDDMISDFEKNAKERMLRKKAKDQLIQEGYNSRGGQV